ncbi:MAG: lactobin A/cerein 7B family class IIb bacteriocin [Glaciecola sp.]|jgi:lactobin A/cerein 7B family class IIb bacteriocin
MQELKFEQVEDVNGGIIPVIAFAGAMAGQFMARTVAQYVVAKVGTITATYGLMEYMGE